MSKSKMNESEYSSIISDVQLDHLDPDSYIGANPEAESIGKSCDEVVVRVESNRIGGFRRSVKRVGYTCLAGAMVATGLFINDKMDDFGDMFDSGSEHSAELEVGAPETELYRDVYLNLASMKSEIPVQLKTSLNRKLDPFNCDTITDHSGKKNHPKIETEISAGLLIDEISVTKQDGEVTLVKVDGDIKLTSPSVDYRRNRINTELSSLSVCINSNELNSARNIIDVAVQESAKLSASCALLNEDGKQAMLSGLYEFIDKLYLTDESSSTTSNLDDKPDYEVVISDYDKSAKAIYGQQVGEFKESVSRVIDDYLAKTKRHKVTRINDGDLIDCDKHTISFPAKPGGQK